MIEENRQVQLRKEEAARTAEVFRQAFFHRVKLDIPSLGDQVEVFAIGIEKVGDEHMNGRIVVAHCMPTDAIENDILPIYRNEDVFLSVFGGLDEGRKLINSVKFSSAVEAANKAYNNAMAFARKMPQTEMTADAPGTRPGP